MKTATMVLMTAMTVCLMLMSLLLLQEIISEETPVGIEQESYCASYRWDNGRLVKSCD